MGDHDADDGTLQVEVVGAVDAVPAAAWDALAGDDNPFVEHAFLALLEESGAVGPATGWLPHHLVVRLGGQVVGAAPMYLKGHSYGEYIFDWSWAHAAERAGLAYYPKLVVAIPFTPATGPRLLIHPDAPRHAVTAALGRGALAVADEIGASGVHWLFCTEGERAELGRFGFAPRASYQFHWDNRGFRDFDDYLEALTRRRRKEVRRERARAAAHRLTIRVVPGTELEPRHWRALDTFYRRTVGYRGGYPYLPPRFFELLGPRLGHRTLAVLAERDGEPVAGTLNFRKGSRLYGRYWGAAEDLDALHFECCYYRLIEYAIAEGIARFEAGAQGEHKIARGFLPVETCSAHRLTHPGLGRMVGAFLRDEAGAVRRHMAWLGASSPYAVDRAREG